MADYDVIRTQLTRGEGWHDGYVVVDHETREVLAIGLSFVGCCTLCSELPDGALTYDSATNTWVLVDHGETSVSLPLPVPEVDVWPVGHELGWGWETREWVEGRRY